MAARETPKQAYARGHADGERVGFIAGMKAAEKKFDLRKTQLDLMKSVTQLVSVAGQSVSAVAQVFDNGPRD
jgi:hypothetical protein